MCASCLPTGQGIAVQGPGFTNCLLDDAGALPWSYATKRG